MMIEIQNTRAKIIEIVENITSQNDIEITHTAFEILHKIFTNLMNNPNEEKFKFIKVNNAVILNKVLILNGCVNDLIEYIGYSQEDYTGDYVFTSFNDFSRLQIATTVISGYITNLSQKVYEQNASRSLSYNKDYMKIKTETEMKLKEEKLEKERIKRLIEEDKIERMNNKK
jgi:hypothetical protein